MSKVYLEAACGQRNHDYYCRVYHGAGTMTGIKLECRFYTKHVNIHDHPHPCYNPVSGDIAACLVLYFVLR